MEFSLRLDASGSRGVWYKASSSARPLKSRMRLVSLMKERKKELIFFKKLIEELRGFTPFVRSPYAPGKRLSRWPSFDQAPQEGDAL